MPGTPGLEAPAGADQLFVTLSGISVDGARPDLRDALAVLERRLVDRRISGADIFAAARELEAAYAAAGYVLVRIVLPPQDLVDGARLRLIAVNGFIERVDADGVPNNVRPHIQRLLAPLVDRKGVTLREIERRILLAGDTPGVLLRSTLVPGQSEGATILVIEAKYQPVSWTASFDNTLASALGRHSFGLGVDFNSLLGLGEIAYLRANTSPDGGDNSVFAEYPRNRALAGGLVLPLWIDGLSLNAEGVDARTTPLPDASGVQSTSVFDRLSLRLRYGWLRSRAANFNSEIAFDSQDESQSVFVAGAPTRLYQDRLRILRLTNDGDLLTSWGASISGHVTASFGLDALGARTAANAGALLPLSQSGADAVFQKVDFGVSYAQPLREHLTASFSLRAQTSFGASLPRSEQFGIANSGALSSFDAGEIVGDQGHVERVELSSPWTLPQGRGAIGNMVSPYIFGAYGDVWLRRPTAVEPGHIGAASYGLGMRLLGAEAGTLNNGMITFEYGRTERSDSLPANDRLTIISIIRF